MATLTIQQGDTLSGIAQSQGTTVDALLGANPNISNPNLIQAGGTLNLPGQEAPVVTPESQVPTTPLPTSQPDNQDFGSVLGGLQNGDNFLQQLEQQQAGEQGLFSQMQELIGEAPSQAELFEQAQRESGILGQRQQVQDFSSQLDAIQKGAQEAILSIGGAERGISAGVAATQASEIQRQAAIKALPVSAQLNAAQGNLALAEQNLSTLFELKASDAQNKYNRDKELITSLFDLASDQEKAKLERIEKLEDRKYEEAQDILKSQEAFAKDAFNNNQASLGAKILSLDTKSPTYKKDLAKLQSQLRDPVKDLAIQKNKLEIRKLNKELSEVNPDAGKLVKINGTDYIRYEDGTISEPVLPGAGDTGLVVERLNDKIQIVNDLAFTEKGKAPLGLVYSAGALRSPLGVPPGLINQVNDWRAGVKNIMSKLTLDELGRVKSDGVTFGALSNGEREAVGQAATTLLSGSVYEGKGDERQPTGKFKISEKKVQEELAIIEKFYKIDFERRTGVDYDEYQNDPSVLDDKITNDYLDLITESRALQASPYSQAGYKLD